MGAVIIGIGLALGLIIIGAGLAIGKIGAAAVDGIARQPEAAGNIRGTAIVLAALVEGATFFALIIAMIGSGTNEANQGVDARIKEAKAMSEFRREEAKKDKEPSK